MFHRWHYRCVAVAAVLLGAFLLAGQLHAQEKKAAAPKEQTKAVKPHDHDHDHDEYGGDGFLHFLAENRTMIQAVSAAVLAVAIALFFVTRLGKKRTNVGPPPTPGKAEEPK